MEDQTLDSGSILEPPPCPRLVGAIPRLRKLWFNPVFQRYYRRSRLRTVIAPRHAFIIAFIYSLLANLGFIIYSIVLNAFSTEVAGFTLVFAVSIPAGLVVAIAFMVMFYVCLIMTPIDLRKDTIPGQEDPVMATPLTDGQIYLGSCLPNFVKGLLIGASVISILAGLLLPSVPSAILLIRYYSIGYEIVLQSTAFALGILLTAVAGYILMMLLLSLAAGMYSSILQAFGAILATLAHYWFITRMTAFVNVFAVLFPAHTAVYDPFMEFASVMQWFLVIELIKKAIIAFGCWLTAVIGVGIFAGARRPGNYYGDTRFPSVRRGGGDVDRS